MPHGHAYNSFSVGLETSGKSDITSAQVETVRLLLVYVRDEVWRLRDLGGGHNGDLSVGCHFQATNKRGLSDPGEAIWRECGAWAIRELGYKMGPTIGSGQPVPEELDAMKAFFEDEEVAVTPRFEAAVVELMKAECEMMAKHDEANPDMAACWFWGRAYVGNLSSSSGFSFIFGAEGDEPDDAGRFAIIEESCDD